MPGAAEKQKPTTPLTAVSPSMITLSGVGVRYLLLSEDQRTFKGRVLNALGSHPSESAKFWALQDIDLEVHRGDVLGVIGRNGSGKSTLIRVMGRIIAPTAGAVDIQGRISPLLELGGAFNGELTGRENAFLYGSIMKLHREQVEELLPEIIAFSELGAFFDIPIKTYSSGMVARLAFAISTQMDPDILLIDEILAVGDEQFQKKCMFRIQKLINRGSIVVLVSHSAELVEHLCNRAVCLSKGRIIANGAPEKVIAAYRKSSAPFLA
jgi:ABC-type polysaccharide/polyol phosphate transport system ATPase subunit